jgi:hypothetical protein
VISLTSQSIGRKTWTCIEGASSIATRRSFDPDCAAFTLR